MGIDEEELFPNAICIITPQMIIFAGIIFFSVLSLVCFYFYHKWDFLIEEAYDKAFDVVDADKSGFIEEVEVELAVVLLYSEVNAYVRIKRPNKKRILEYFKMVDVDNSKRLDRDEFRSLMKLLGASIVARGATMMLLTVLSPIFAAKLIDIVQELSLVVTSSFQSRSHDLVGEGCLLKTFEAFSDKMPFLDENLLTTMLTIFLVKGVAPSLFSLYDAELFFDGDSSGSSGGSNDETKED